jgi:hypothetical protein
MGKCLLEERVRYARRAAWMGTKRAGRNELGCRASVATITSFIISMVMVTAEYIIAL